MDIRPRRGEAVCSAFFLKGGLGGHSFLSYPIKNDHCRNADYSNPNQKEADEKSGAAQRRQHMIIESPHPYTTLALSGYLYAKDHGLGIEYIDSTFHTFYAEERDIGELPVIEQILADLGLQPAPFVEAVSVGAFLNRLDAGKERGRSIGVKGIPAVEMDGRLVDLDTVEETLFGSCGEDGCSL